jgi:hypothetical protein
MRLVVCAGSRGRRKFYPLMIDASGIIQVRYRRVPLFLRFSLHVMMVKSRGQAVLH